MIEGDTCPYCNAPAYRLNAEDPVCAHFLMGVSMDVDCCVEPWLSPVWVNEEFDPLSTVVKEATDALFQTLQAYPEMLKATYGIFGWAFPKRLKHLLRGLRLYREKYWTPEDGSFFEIVSSSCQEEFVEYLVALHSELVGEKACMRSYLSHSPGLDWVTYYFWSPDPDQTSRQIAEQIEADRLCLVSKTRLGRDVS